MAEVDTEVDVQETREAINQYSLFLQTLTSDLAIAKKILKKHEHDLGAVKAFIKDVEDIQQVSNGVRLA
jgi:proline dehydrogenase